MELRSRHSGPSKGKNIQYIGSSSSDEDGACVISSDSEYHGVIDEGEDSVSMMKDSSGVDVMDLNSVPAAEVEFIGGISSNVNVPNTRKVAKGKKKRHSCRRDERGEDREVVGRSNEDDREVVGRTNEDEQILETLEIDLLGIMEKYAEERKKKNKRKRNGPPLMWEVLEEENNRWVDQNMMIDLDLDNQNDVIAETAEPPSDLIMPLLRYQKEWLAWAMKQEQSFVRGGILADEMGMGKTVQAIALVLAKREFRLAVGNSSLPSSSTGLPEVKGTLVICPLVAVIQWVNEIDRFTTKGSNKVLVYHGAKREKSLHQFSEYDFIITTYSIVESEYRKNVMPPKQKCEWCGKSFYDKKMAIHLKYFCGPDAIRTNKQSKQQRKGKKLEEKVSKRKTSAKGKEISESEDDKDKGSRRKARKHYKKEKELENECPDDDLSTKKSHLHSVKWDRIILDEAHYIKDRRCNTTKAVLALESSYKWALSGTPLQNRVGELYSLVRFLQITPYSYYFCKDCDCRELDYSSTANCPSCPHKAVRHFCWWNKYIATPIQAFGNVGDGERAMILLKNKLLKSIVLRRTKKGRASDLALPPRIVSLRRDSLDIKEEDYYISLYNESQAQFNTYVEQGTLMNNYAHIFDLLTRLRQAVDHPYLVVYSNSAMAKAGCTLDANIGEQVCGLCHDPVEDPVMTSCSHVFCKSCLIDFSTSVGQVLCPSCSKPITVDFSSNNDQNNRTAVKGFKRTSILNRIRLEDFQSSTKIDALREEIRYMVERDGSAKGIVFSQFTSFLDLIHYSLQKSGVNCVQLVGSMSMGARDAAITKFTNDPDCRIFLMSLKAGGVALNLTVASHVFLMDPWWNPAVERQAQDRIHRIGQYKPIRIVRFVIGDTIEERILKLQEKKELVFEGTVGGSSEALGKLTEADMKFLFVT